jgi:zinc protease
MTGNAGPDADDPVAGILDTYEKACLRPLETYVESESKTFPYLVRPELSPSVVKKREDHVQDLGITTIEFDNNVRLNLKRTDFKKNEILFKVCFGQGKKSEPLSKPGLSFMAESVIRKSGLGQLNADQMEETLAGRKISIDFDINDNSFSFSGSADPEETELLFQLIYHYIKDPGFREEALDRSKIQYQQMYDSLLRKPEGMMQIKGDLFLAKNDLRFGLPDPSIIRQYSLKDIRDWLTPYLNNSPIEVSIIGDINPEKIIFLASDYLGTLSKREDGTHKMTHLEQIGFPEGEQLDLKIDTKI